MSMAEQLLNIVAVLGGAVMLYAFIVWVLFTLQDWLAPWPHEKGAPHTLLFVLKRQWQAVTKDGRPRIW